MIVQIVRFRSGLPEDRVVETYRGRAPQYRAVPGLIQKYYLRFPETGEHGAVYLWESENALEQFRASELSRTIPSAYRIDGTPNVHIAEVVMALRPDAGRE
jgi:heme-degrading monooxygenase HmoA